MPWVIREDWDAREAPDIYFTRPYLDLHRTEAARPLLYEFSQGKARFRLPFLEGSIAAWFAEAGPGAKDMETAYGYGGGWTDSTDPGFLAAAMQGLDEACRERGIVAGFLRYHPLLANQDWTPGFRVFPDRETVCVDLEDGDIWMNQISQKNRNMIRKAEKEGVEFRIDGGFGDLAGFRRLYGDTMERLGAHASYRFEDAYFDRLPAALAGHGFLAECRYQGETVAAALIMAWGRFGHYHLSGSKREFQHLAPNNLMLYRTILELRARGFARFHLGGGLGPDAGDPLFKFKKAFSRNTLRFHFGKRIFSEGEYGRILEAWGRKHPDKAATAASRVLFYRF